MGTSRELIEKLQSDEEFAKEFGAALQARREAGAKDVFETLIPVAAEYGYEVTREDIEATLAQQSEELSEEELGKVAGGTCLYMFIALCTASVIGATIAYSITSDDDD